MRLTPRLASTLLALSLSAASAQTAGTTVDTSVDYKLINKGSGLVLGIQYASQIAGAPALQWIDNGTPDHLWHLYPNVGGYFKLMNVNSAEVLGISAASLASGAAALQWADNETDDHVWKVLPQGDGTVKIQNGNSGLLLAIQNSSKDPGGTADQEPDTGSANQVWTLVPAGTAYPDSIPVYGATDIHDPSMVQTPAGGYLLFGTHDGIHEHSSPDSIHWTDIGQAFGTQPAWTGQYDNHDNDLWAPGVKYLNGRYFMYYAASTFGTRTSAIGVATSATGAPGSFVDSGSPVITSGFINNAYTRYNAIDPDLVVATDGTWWMNFGSYSEDGIDMIQIDPSTGRQLASNPTLYQLANRFGGPLSGGNEIEGSFVYPHGGFYYLFASFDGCCAGTNSTYHIVVGRSTAPNGPYTDRGGLPMTVGGGTVVLAAHGRFIGPGGQGVLHNGTGDLLYYHFYNGLENGYPRLGMNYLSWDNNGWPYIAATPAQATVTLRLTARAATAPAHELASVTVASSGSTPAAGSITVFDGGTVVGTGILTNGAVSVALTALAAGTHTLTASFAGSGGYPSGTSNAVTLIVNGAS